MLKKIIKIKGVGAFSSYGAGGDVAFRSFTAIWGPNGVGKSTLCDILRSVASGEPEPVLGRRSLTVSGDPEVELMFDDGKHSFRDGKWDSSEAPAIHIFDNCFIHDNLFIGDYVEHDQRKNLYRFMVGETGVSLAAKIDDLDARHREATSDVSKKRDAISKTLPEGFDVDQYLALREDPGVSAKIATKEVELNAVQQAEVIAKRPHLATLSLPTIPKDIDDLLSETIEGIAASSERLVREHLLHAKVREGWLSEGLRSVKDDQCPFCGQDVSATELLRAFRGYFSEEYGSLKERIAAVRTTVTTSFGEVPLQQLRNTVARNIELGQEWAPLLGETWRRELSFEPLNSAREALLSALQQKESSPLDHVPPILSSEPLVAFARLAGEVKQYNAAIIAYNAMVDDMKTKAKANVVDVVRKDLVVLKAHRDRFEPTHRTGCDELREAIATRKKLDQEKVEAKKQLDAHASAILGAYQGAINRYLQMFGASFRITRLERRYSGGTPSSLYALEINNALVELGDRKTSRATPSFRNTLSAGDRSALALAFFLAQLNRDSDLGTKIVVFDDPFTSQDRARRKCTQQEIRAIAKNAAQVIVFSHDEDFLAECCKHVEPGQLKTLQLRRAMGVPTILEWDAAAPRSELLQDHQALKDFLAKGETDLVALRATAGKVRLLLEGHLRGRFVNKFGSTETLGGMIGILREHQDQIPNGKELVDELSLINEYSQAYHHSNPNAQNEPIDDVELHSWVERALAIADGF